MHRRRHRVIALLLLAALLPLTACDTGPAVSGRDRTPGWVEDGTGELALKVTGQPMPGTLRTTQLVLRHLRDRDADALAALALNDDREPYAVAQRWVEQWGEAAQKPALADFEGPDLTRVTVTVRFEGTADPFELVLDRADDEFGVVLPQPAGQ
ncbi:hypothetical protein OG897_29970 [Streptomyces sp. NBC_00237]|uniref:hypothetical protein n=1 Tax=Streptomyces sp. NBC_00237 TaxID=2975687 RepID=UPI0022579CBE|nr:hypothetical protein [Streptomyces sp. NBC_00237]MCX5205668.1 hypothetical protein [Streptomyces sp. NBC_00237]